MIFFLDMDFVLNKAHYASYNTMFRRNILTIAQKCEEYHELSINFFNELCQINFLEKEEELTESKRRILEEVYKNNLVDFLVCHQIWQKFSPEFILLEKTTMAYAIVYEMKKSKSFMTEIEKLSFLHAKVTVLTKTYLKVFFRYVCMYFSH